MKRIVDVFTCDWSPELVWSYIVSLEGNENSVQLNKDELDTQAFENEAIRLAIEDGRGELGELRAKARE